MKRILNILALTALSGCALRDAPRSNTLVDGGAEVSTNDHILTLEGFAVSGHYSENTGEAISAAVSACTDLISDAHRMFGQFRVLDNFNENYTKRCGTPKNETPFGRGFFYVFRPTIKIRVDLDDQIQEIPGPEISGEEAAQHNLFTAYLSFNEVCLEQMRKLQEEMGPKFVAASCGKAQAKVRMAYIESHRSEMPNLTVFAKMKVYVRANQPGKAPSFAPIVIKPLFEISMIGRATGLKQAGAGAPMVIASHFAGSITKIDLRSKKIIWERNLTNPEPSSVRMASSIDAIDVTHDGEIIAAGGTYGYLALVEGRSGRKTMVLSCDPQMFAPKHFVSLRFDQSKRRLYSVAEITKYPPGDTGYNRMSFPRTQDKVRVEYDVSQWDVETGKETWKVRHAGGNAMDIGLNSENSFVYVADTKGIVILSVKDGSLIRRYDLASFESELTGSMITGAAFSSDMRLLAISAFSGVMLIDTQSGKLLRRLRAPLRFELGNPEIALDENRVLAFDAWGSFYSWNLTTGELTGQGRNEKVQLAGNGPFVMPIISMESGAFVALSAASGGTSIATPSLQPPTIQTDRICKAGPDSELAPIQLRNGRGKLQVWTKL